MILLFHCRAGFENDLAAEVLARFADSDIRGYINAKANQGYIQYVVFDTECSALLSACDVSDFIFARQICVITHQFNELDEADRITPIMQQLPEHFGEVLLEYPETNAGKQISPFLKKFERPLMSALKKQNAYQPSSHQRLHVFFLNSASVWIGVSLKRHSSVATNGIYRLKTPQGAPSRSGLKLDEAFRMLVPTQVQASLIDGCRGVDLGAAPGGWTHQLVRRGLYVYAIDNGPMDSALMETNMVEHLQADGFKWRPENAVDMLVCDMVEKPQRVAALMVDWLHRGDTRHTVFNLKLPMKKRYDMVRDCCSQFESLCQKGFVIRVKHLYHDREEVTVYAGYP